MLLELLVSAGLCFLLLLVLLLFYIRHIYRVPYYRFTQADAVKLLERAILGELPEREWTVFIGMEIRDNPGLESLRECCIFIDESCVKSNCYVNGQSCVIFNKDGLAQLDELLDEWRYKSQYDA